MNINTITNHINDVTVPIIPTNAVGHGFGIGMATACLMLLSACVTIAELERSRVAEI
jgi:hypothetical protein